MHQTYFLDIKGLSVEFRTRNGTIRAVDDINFHLSKGEFLGIVGESGSGKSVTAYSVMGLLDSAGHPVCGQIMYDGIDIIKATENNIANSRVFFIPLKLMKKSSLAKKRYFMMH